MGATSMPSGPQIGFGPAPIGQNPMDGQIDPTTGQPYAVSANPMPQGLPSQGMGGGKTIGPVNTLAPGGGGMDYNGNAIGSDFGGQFNYGGAAPQGPQMGFGFNPNTGGPLGGPGIAQPRIITDPMQTQAFTAPGPQQMNPIQQEMMNRQFNAAGAGNSVRLQMMNTGSPNASSMRTAGAAGMPTMPTAQMQSVNARPQQQMTANSVQRQQNNVFSDVRGGTAYGAPVNRYAPPNAPGVRSGLTPMQQAQFGAAGQLGSARANLVAGRAPMSNAVAARSGRR